MKIIIYFSRSIFSIILLQFIFLCYSSDARAQESFIYMDNNKFMLDCEEFYPLVMCYPVKIIQNLNDEFHIGPQPGFCVWDYSCNGCTCGSNAQEWNNEILEHLDTISSMGYNVVRLNGVSVAVRIVSVNHGLTMALTGDDYRIQDTNNLNCLDPTDYNFVLDSSTYHIHSAMIAEFIGLVRQHNVMHPERPLRISITTGVGSMEQTSTEYADYLAYLGNYFKNEPLIFSWEIQTEAFYHGLIHWETNNKYTRTNNFAEWYYALKDVSPRHFITHGALLEDVLNWDSNVFPVDYINLHLYPDQSKRIFSDTTYHLYYSIVKWLAETTNKPWIIGETNISGNDSIHTFIPQFVTEQEQKEFNEEILKYTRWCGAIGFTSWKYKETGWFIQDPNATVHQKAEDYLGFVYRTDENQTTKPVANAIRYYDPTVECTDCTFPDEGIFYNPQGYTDLAVSGTITDAIGNPIKNAFVLAYSDLHNQDTIILYKNYHTFSDSTGHYEIFRDSVYTIYRVEISAPGMKFVTNTSVVSPGYSTVINCTLEALDPVLLPTPITLNDTLIISTGQHISWDSLAVVNEKYIVVDSGAMLTITDTVWMKPGARYIVKPGGEMVIEGGCITGYCDWKGIEVWGNPQASQTPANQGRLVMMNGATIENAETAVQVGRMVVPDGGEEIEDGHGGGIVYASEAVFRNNRTGVVFHAYSGYNLSNFEDCIFETTRSLPGDETPLNHLVLTSVKSLDIKGCVFRNTRSGAISFDERGNGIYCFNSSCNIDELCITDTIPCNQYQDTRFEGLYYGIKALGLSSALAPSVQNTGFVDNFRGVYISGITWALVKNCYFEINTPWATDGGYGLYLDNSTAYTIEENNFYNDSTAHIGIGMIVHNSGSDPNEVYRNWFTGLEQGISAQEQNRETLFTPAQGLQILCCEFDDCGYDILIPEPESRYWGIAQNQGANSKIAEDMAGNLFDINGQTPDGDFDDINNQGTQMVYYYPINYAQGYIGVIPVDYTSSTVTLMGRHVSSTWTFNVGCPESTSGGSTDESALRTVIDESNNAINAISQDLETLVDGGNTQGLYLEVVNSTQPESMDIYNDLMAGSPYLSDTVMGASILKEDVIPGAMLRDVMVANPQAAKSEKLMEKLDNRYTPLPEYMKAQILESRNEVSLKESMESELAKYMQYKSRAIKSLVRYYLYSQSLPGWQDSITALLINDDKLPSKYRMALWQLYLGDTVQAKVTLNQIPLQYNLIGAQLQSYQDMTSIFDIITNVMNTFNTWGSLNNQQVQQLSSLTQNNTPAANIARNILVMSNNIEYSEPIQMPDMLKSTEAERAYSELLNYNAPSLLELYPNPADDYVVLGYHLDFDPRDINIRIENLKGDLIQTLYISQKENQVIINTQTWPAGIYFISLEQRGDIIETIKLSIVK